MHLAETILVADLGPKVAAVTVARTEGPAAVINERCDSDPVMRNQAAWSLIGAGYDAGQILGALHGVRR